MIGPISVVLLSVHQSYINRSSGTDCRPMIGLILSRQLLVRLYQADVPDNIVSPIIGLLIYWTDVWVSIDPPIYGL